ncbi:Tigger transposable element-derived protein 7-like 59, partial [Homarus americanus]
LNKYTMKFNVDQVKSGIKRMRKVGKEGLEEAVYKYFPGFTDLVPAVNRDILSLARQAGFDELESEDIEDVLASHTEELTNEDLQQLTEHNETGLYWRALPENTQASRSEKSVPGRKLSKKRVSALLCANADGSHILSPVVMEDTRGQRTLRNLKKYNFRSILFNFATSAKEVKARTLINAWKKLLYDIDEEHDFEKDATVEEVETWLEADEDDLRYHNLTEEIVDSVHEAADNFDDDDDEEKEDEPPKIKLPGARDCLDTLIEFTHQKKKWGLLRSL